MMFGRVKWADGQLAPSHGSKTVPDPGAGAASYRPPRYDTPPPFPVDGEQIPDAKVVFVKGADHFTLLKKERAYAGHIVRWLREKGL